MIQDTGPVEVLGHFHYPECLVARYPDPATWDGSGFPWCTCGRTETKRAAS